MVGFIKFCKIFNRTALRRFETMDVDIVLKRCCHFGPGTVFGSSESLSYTTQKTADNHVGVFWDLDNKPPNSFPPYDVALKIKAVASSFGVARYMVAYANHHAFSYVPPVIREQRREKKHLDRLENSGVIKPAGPYLCRVCGRKFYRNDKLINHFKQIHEREQKKRLNQIESSRGNSRVKLVAKFSMKMDKYRNAARDVLTPKVGYGLAYELKRAGFWVRTVPDKPQAADIALRNHMVDMMDRNRVECLVLVSDDSDFVDVLKEAKLRCLKTVVVGDSNDGVLKRAADIGFSWKEIMLGKAKKEAQMVLGRWKDRDVLKRLEWTYNPEIEKKVYDLDDDIGFEDENGDIEDFAFGKEDDCPQKKGNGAWWELGPDAKVRSD